MSNNQDQFIPTSVYNLTQLICGIQDVLEGAAEATELTLNGILEKPNPLCREPRNLESQNALMFLEENYSLLSGACRAGAAIMNIIAEGIVDDVITFQGGQFYETLKTCTEASAEATC